VEQAEHITVAVIATAALVAGAGDQFIMQAHILIDQVLDIEETVVASH
jgi:hypothetical protein